MADGDSPDSAFRFLAVAGGEEWLGAGGELEACEPCDEAILVDRRAILMNLTAARAIHNIIWQEKGKNLMVRKNRNKCGLVRVSVLQHKNGATGSEVDQEVVDYTLMNSDVIG